MPNQPLIVSWLILFCCYPFFLPSSWVLVSFSSTSTSSYLFDWPACDSSLSLLHCCYRRHQRLSPPRHIYSRLWESLHSLIHRLWPTVLQLTLLASRLSCAVLSSTYRPPCPAPKSRKESFFLSRLTIWHLPEGID